MYSRGIKVLLKFREIFYLEKVVVKDKRDKVLFKKKKKEDKIK